VQNIFPQTRLQSKTNQGSSVGPSSKSSKAIAANFGLPRRRRDSYSCSSGLSVGVAVSLLPCFSRCRGAFVLSLGLPSVDGDSRVSGDDPASAPPLGDGVARVLPRWPLVSVVDGLPVSRPDGEAVARGLASAVARGLAAAVARGVGDPLPVGEDVAAGDPVAAGDAVAIGEAPGLAAAPVAPATPVVVVVVPETPTPALTP
jgi:hypothetical protein